VGYLIILVALFAAMWFFMVRPQKRRQVEQSQMQNALAEGDEILTAGGIHGTVRGIEEEIVQVEIAPGTIVRLDRRAVATVVHGEPEPDTEEFEAGADDPVSRGES
jgi:preprotein translocase subunit YajC